MYKFDEWLSDCPVPFTQEKDNGDWITFNFEVSVLEKEKKEQGRIMNYEEMWEALEQLKEKGIVINVAKDFGDSLMLSFSNWEEE